MTLCLGYLSVLFKYGEVLGPNEDNCFCSQFLKHEELLNPQSVCCPCYDFPVDYDESPKGLLCII
jgi:hypothetical protein